MVNVVNCLGVEFSMAVYLYAHKRESLEAYPLIPQLMNSENGFSEIVHRRDAFHHSRMP